MKARAWLLLLIALAAIGFWWQKAQQQAQLRDAAAKQYLLKEPLPGSAMLKDYSKPQRTVQDDLTDLGHAMNNFMLLMKGADPIPLGANEDIAAALLGLRKVQMPFLAKEDPCFNAAGQLIDRWGTALYFHAIDKQRLDIRSAGADKKMWTEDDVHRRYDGRFVRAEELNTPSLFESMRDYK
jgi:hypothetical protein